MRKFLQKQSKSSFYKIGLDSVCGARNGLKGSKGEPGHPGEAGK